MNQTILFSPVGGTDPVSTTNCYDGALLHISRVYRPDKIVMYMSKEMLDYQKEDDLKDSMKCNIVRLHMR